MKKFVSIFLAMAMAASLMACGQSQGGAAISQVEEKAEEVAEEAEEAVEDWDLL